MIRCIIVLLLALAAMPATAQNASTPAPQASPAISTEAVSDAQDREVAARIRAIFAQIESLRSVRVTVASGVATLSGSVAGAADAERAGAIAERVSGVVTVQNDIDRDLAVQQNLSPALGQFGADLRALLRALPLLAVAVGIAALIAALGYLLAGRNRFWRWIAPNIFLAELLQTSIRFVFVVLGLVAALEILGATALLGAVLGGAGVIGIALGFAVRDTADNYVSSLMLSLRQPFRANDHVVIEGQEGRVLRLTSRATILMTLDGNHLRIPNSTVFKAVILNYTRNPERRFEFDLGVDADDDPVDAMGVGLAALNGLDFVLDTPRASAVIQQVGDSNIVLRFYGWVDQTHTDFAKGRSLAIQATKAALEAAGFALPEPIYRLRFDEGAPLPLARAQAAETVPAKPRTAAGKRDATDTRPETHIEKLVAEERAGDRETDLLDSTKPIE
ncbi:mechanosensitive ion channel [Stakelama sp. CBK3Z-3]|uniref:Small-conductance mechanosensitive channel n=1 Tax=Stakelama flava TaxID=2860338 RepID=A0ABS6XNU2_9SPHN|nr:mechanosensitive ion channel domain-containing protein [Stakelama flava]MBW4331841.1 mechanosensitive ion channel [Stakelama flava]